MQFWQRQVERLKALQVGDLGCLPVVDCCPLVGLEMVGGLCPLLGLGVEKDSSPSSDL